nr:PREDICTED: uncharacterized protein LOC107079804 [Lepisosteus oculatus]
MKLNGLIEQQGVRLAPASLGKRDVDTHPPHTGLTAPTQAGRRTPPGSAAASCGPGPDPFVYRQVIGRATVRGRATQPDWSGDWPGRPPVPLHLTLPDGRPRLLGARRPLETVRRFVLPCRAARDAEARSCCLSRGPPPVTRGTNAGPVGTEKRRPSPQGVRGGGGQSVLKPRRSVPVEESSSSAARSGGSPRPARPFYLCRSSAVFPTHLSVLQQGSHTPHLAESEALISPCCCAHIHILLHICLTLLELPSQALLGRLQRCLSRALLSAAPSAAGRPLLRRRLLQLRSCILHPPHLPWTLPLGLSLRSVCLSLNNIGAGFVFVHVWRHPATSLNECHSLSLLIMYFFYSIGMSFD